MSWCRALEEEFTRQRRIAELDQERDRAILVSVSTESEAAGRSRSLEELGNWPDQMILWCSTRCCSAAERSIRALSSGRGKLTDIVITALRLDANLLIFNQELNPSQIRSITDFTDLG